ncbi:MAG TPA: hypothetical protein VEX66_04080, partial [Microlunatus sp.]|nr:hypothetical protein [Microlunatus sp.]
MGGILLVEPVLVDRWLFIEAGILAAATISGGVAKGVAVDGVCGVLALVVGRIVLGGQLSVGLVDQPLLVPAGIGVVVGAAGPGVVEVVHIVEAGLVVVAVPSGLPAGGWEVVGGPRVGRIILVRSGPVFGVAVLVGLVGVPGQQVPQPCLVGDDAEGFGAADPDRVLITLLSQTPCDQVDQRFEGGHIPGLGAGDQGP